MKNLKYYLEDLTRLEEVSLEQLSDWAKEAPFSQPLKILMAYKLKRSVSSGTALGKAAAYQSDTKHLLSVRNSDTSSQLLDTVELPEAVEEEKNSIDTTDVALEKVTADDENPVTENINELQESDIENDSTPSEKEIEKEKTVEKEETVSVTKEDDKKQITSEISDDIPKSDDIPSNTKNASSEQEKQLDVETSPDETETSYVKMIDTRPLKKRRDKKKKKIKLLGKKSSEKSAAKNAKSRKKAEEKIEEETKQEYIEAVPRSKKKKNKLAKPKRKKTTIVDKESKEVVSKYDDDLSGLSEFTRWLLGQKPIDTEKKGLGKKSKKKGRTKKKKISEDIMKSVQFNEDILSEHLADILLEQGHHKRAKKMYEKLSLIFPEKSTYFAAKIEKTIKKDK